MFLCLSIVLYFVTGRISTPKTEYELSHGGSDCETIWCLFSYFGATAHTHTHTNAHCKYLNPTLAQSPNTYLGVLMVEVPEPSPSPPPQRANISDNPCWASAQSWCAEKSVGAADLKETLSRSERRSATEWGGGGRVRAWDEGRGGWRRRRRRRESWEGGGGGRGEVMAVDCFSAVTVLWQVLGFWLAEGGGAGGASPSAGSSRYGRAKWHHLLSNYGRGRSGKQSNSRNLQPDKTNRLLNGSAGW